MGSYEKYDDENMKSWYSAMLQPDEKVVVAVY